MPTDNSTPLLLVVDDDAGQRSLLTTFLNTQGFKVQAASSALEALHALKQQPEIRMMISDVRMPGMTGLEALRELRQRQHNLPVLLVTAYADIRDAVDAMRDGAVNYLEKPIDLDELLTSVRNALGILPTQNPAAPAPITLPNHIIAKSPEMLAVFREAAVVAQSDTRILITGESGVGKEIISDWIHSQSPRANGPCIKVNCAAIPENLLESELFGHEKGAFTGAVSQHIGRFEEACNGTILLDEIGEMSPTLQAKLLRITQDGTFQRVGGSGTQQTNARVLAATNQNLELAVREGRFREDLFYRLNVMEIYIPPLRERKMDILPLAQAFARRYAKGNIRFSNQVIQILEIYEWPGNVRELQNAMERATLLARGEMILPEHLPQRIRQSTKTADILNGETNVAPAGNLMEEMERTTILRTLQQCNYNRTETARTLGISRRALLYKLQRFQALGYAIQSDIHA
ncbi:TPA: two-component system response regulator [Candidatus Sumerlaeota bacterium]|nr:two-component system response regulator [Candidatus Sumerlaeota bacterium]